MAELVEFVGDPKLVAKHMFASEASRCYYFRVRVRWCVHRRASLQRGPGAEPRWGVRGAKPPGKFLAK